MRYASYGVSSGHPVESIFLSRSTTLSMAAESAVLSAEKGSTSPDEMVSTATRSLAARPAFRKFLAAALAWYRSPGGMLMSSKTMPTKRGLACFAAVGAAVAVAAGVKLCTEKADTSRRLPLSQTWKSDLPSPLTGWPRLSRTTTPTSTSRLSVLTAYAGFGK